MAKVFGKSWPLDYNQLTMGPEEQRVELLDEIMEPLQSYFETKNAARDRALARSRLLIRHSARAIRAAHRAEHDAAAELLDTARREAQQMLDELAEHPDLLHSGYTQDALKEYAEANITFALITDRPLPTPNELGVLPAAYLNGLAEAMGEMRRYILDVMRQGQVERCEQKLQIMEDVYSALVTVDYPDALTSGLRRTTDMVRGVLERTRGDLTMAARQEALRQELREFEQRISSPQRAAAGQEDAA